MPEQTQQWKSPDPRTNRLMGRLDQKDFDAVMRNARIILLKFRNRPLRQDEPVNCVYFPLTCMISVLVTDGDKVQMEMVTIGKEGVVGAPRPEIRVELQVFSRSRKDKRIDSAYRV